MGDFVALFAPIFSTPTTYSQMLKKLAGFVFYEVYIITFFLRDIPQVDAAFQRIESFGKMGEAIATIPNAPSINISGLAIALIIAIASFVIKLHDRIADLLLIRLYFDREKIVRPLAELVGLHLSDGQLQSFESNRHRVMREVFYKYASSRDEQPLVDKHDIEHALAAWSWFWVFEEGALNPREKGLLTTPVYHSLSCAVRAGRVARDCG